MQVSRVGRSSKLYVLLYSHIIKNGKLDEPKLLKKHPQIKKSQLSNLRAQLYTQLLRSIRDLRKENYAEIKAREQFDFAKILYSKGQYKASLDMLQKAKEYAMILNQRPLEYLAINFEKHIESHHITGSVSNKAKHLDRESKDIIAQLELTNQLSNLSLLLYGMFLKRGYVKDQNGHNFIRSFYENHLPDFEYTSLDFYQKLYLDQAQVWYYQMLQDFSQYYKFSRRWVDLFEEYPEMKRPETTLYIKGIHNVLNALFLAKKTNLFEENLKLFNQIQSDKQLSLSLNERSQLILFKSIHQINNIFLKANYKDDHSFIEEIKTILDKKIYPWDINRNIIFRYKIACVHFGANQLDLCSKQLDIIVNKALKGINVDIQCFARILNLIAHFDKGNELLVAYKVKSVFRFLLKMEELGEVQKEILRFIRKTPSIAPSDIIEEFKQLKTKLIVLEKDPIQRRPFLYLDIISWLDSKIFKISMADAIRRRKR